MRAMVLIMVIAAIGCGTVDEGSPQQRGDVDGAGGAQAADAGVLGAGGSGATAAGGRAGAGGVPAGAGGAIGTGGAVASAGGAPGWAPSDPQVFSCQALGWTPTRVTACVSGSAYRYTADGRPCATCPRPAGAPGDACLAGSGPAFFCVVTSCNECPVLVVGENGAGPLPKCSAPTNVVACNSSARTSAGQTCSTCSSASQNGCLLSPTAVCSATCQECWNL